VIATRDFWIVALLLCAALAFGGAGSYYPRLELLLELAALGTLAYFALTRRNWPADKLTLFAFALGAGALIFPLAQLIPLPPGLWQKLPGRQFVVDLDALLGWQGKWRPLSLDPGATLRSALILLPPVAMLVGVRFLNTQERHRLMQVVVGFALLSALLGSIQLATGGKLTPFPSAHLGYPVGLFVNRNHQAAFLLLALPILAALGALRAPVKRGVGPPLMITVAFCLMLSAVIIATSSRMGSALLVLSLGACVFLLFSSERLRRFAAPALIAASIFAVLLFESGPFSKLLGRLSALNDGRFGYWQDLGYVFDKYGFFGTGFGTFVPVQQSMESLTHVSQTYLNHAHNDYLEVALEGGLPAIALMFLFAAFLLLAAKGLLANNVSPHRRLLSSAVCCGILCVLLFSLVDYPLRMPALSTAFALLCGSLLPTPRGDAPDAEAEGRRKRKRWTWSRRRYALAAAVTIASGWVAIASASAEADIIAQRYSSAIAWAPWSAGAYARRSDIYLSHRQFSEAAADANKALRISPLQLSAIRSLGIIDLASGFERTGDRLMLVAARLAWRDPVTQLWAIDALLRASEPEKAAQRMQALLRQGDVPPSALLVFERANSPAALKALAGVLARDENARAAFLKLAARADPAQFGIIEETASDMGRTPRPLSPAELEPILRRLAATKGLSHAQRLWRASRGNLLIANGAFEMADAAGRSPLAWSASPGPGASVLVMKPGRSASGAALRIYQPAYTTSAISQLLMLDPGRYTATYLSNGAAAGAKPVQPRVSCTRSNMALDLHEPPGAPKPAAWQMHSFSFLVPERDCPIQRLSLVMKNSVNGPVTVWIDNVGLAASGEGDGNFR
jgi:O-antigen ligase